MQYRRAPKAHALCDALNLALIPIEELPNYVPGWHHRWHQDHPAGPPRPS